MFLLLHNAPIPWFYVIQHNGAIFLYYYCIIS